MNIITIIPQGHTEITVNGLHQWDYGRKLEIHSDGLPAIVEVHFACPGMTEATVRSCAVVEGVATVAIPDKCLEQTAPIIAWVYEIDGTTGVTTAKITLPVEARTRPSMSEDIPEDVSNQYTEAVTAMNQAVAALANGNTTVARAVADGNGSNIPGTYATKSDLSIHQQDLEEGRFVVAEAKHADSAGTAGEASLVKAENKFDVEIANGQATFGFDAEAGDVLLLAFNNCSGVLHYTRIGTGITNLGKYRFYIEYDYINGDRVQIYDMEADEPTTEGVAGTLSFYKLGTTAI